MISILNNKVAYQKPLLLSCVEIKFSPKCAIFFTDTSKSMTDKKEQFENDSCNVPPLNYFWINFKSLKYVKKYYGFEVWLINTMEEISDRENKMSMYLNVLYPGNISLLRGNKIHH